MASPAADSYSTSGLVAYAGQPPLPDYVPEPGYRANISRNSISSTWNASEDGAWYDGGQTRPPFRNWSGSAFAPNVGTYGAQIFWGGGHDGGEDHSLWIFWFDTQTWTRVTPGIPATSYISSINPAWCDFLHAGSYIVPASHAYSYPIYIPPGYDGIGPLGAWLLSCINNGSGTHAHAPHLVDIATGVWKRATTSSATVTSGTIYGGGYFDAARHCAVWGTADATEYCYINFLEADGPRTLHKIALEWNGYWPAWYGVYSVVPEMTCPGQACVFYSVGTPRVVKMQVINIPTLGVVPPLFGTEVTLPTLNLNPGFGADWCPDTGKFYLYAGYGAETVYTLTPSSLNFTAATWALGSETFGGPPPAYSTADDSSLIGGAIPLSRWRYNRRLKSFMWPGSQNVSALCVDGSTHDGVMQLWRPLGT